MVLHILTNFRSQISTSATKLGVRNIAFLGYGILLMNYIVSVLAAVYMPQGKKGIWLRLPLEKSDLVPIANKEGFGYHHAEPGYVMLTYWISEGPSMLQVNGSHIM
ncbi:homogentisate solanesyltransferase [Vigna unguiculata]|uniref:Homogentisate solanesyltransferase n=1 Tax=Vigna unguiculata TaxID=3917 RepID=A0A4D6LIJ9_VIGUN|nr:homogentisate solanesyltransferase [Vigna unguiculata]